MSAGFKLIEKFIYECRTMGYRVEGSVVKIDYSGSGWTVGFWFRPTGWDGKEYALPGRCGRAKDRDLKIAVEKAIEKATEYEK